MKITIKTDETSAPVPIELKDVLDWACSERGAQMGRCNWLPDDRFLPIKLRMEALSLQDGDYDKGGAYWGYTPGTRIYCAYGQDADGKAIRIFTRAEAPTAAARRLAAKRVVREHLPKAKFYR